MPVLSFRKIGKRRINGKRKIDEVDLSTSASDDSGDWDIGPASRSTATKKYRPITWVEVEDDLDEV